MKCFRGFASLTLLCVFLLFSASFQAGSAEQCGAQAGGALCPDGRCCSQYGWRGDTLEFCGWGCQSQCDADDDSSVNDIMQSGLLFEIMFEHCIYDKCPEGANFYNYEAFIKATKLFPEFGATGDIETRKRETAAFFAQTGHLTTGGRRGPPFDPYIYGYCIVKDPSPKPKDYCGPSDYCEHGRKNYGRDPI